MIHYPSYPRDISPWDEALRRMAYASPSGDPCDPRVFPGCTGPEGLYYATKRKKRK